jgi:hypothetical protein
LLLLFVFAFLMRAFSWRDVFPSFFHLISLLLHDLTFISHMGAVWSMGQARCFGCWCIRIIFHWLGLALFVIWLFCWLLRVVLISFWLVLLFKWRIKLICKLITIHHVKKSLTEHPMMSNLSGCK